MSPMRSFVGAALCVLVSLFPLPDAAASTASLRVAGPGKGALAANDGRVLHDADGDRITEELEAALPASGRVDVIVDLEGRPTDALLSELHRSAGPFEVSRRFRHVGAFSASLTPDQVRALAARPGVRTISQDLEFRAQLDSATSSQGVGDARTDFSVNGSRDGSSSYSKEDVVVAVVDTGIDAGHVDLDDGKVLAFVDCTSGDCVEKEPFDDNGHGTSVASIAAGEGAGSGLYRGVGPGAALVGVKVLGSDGSGTGESFLAGVDWILANHIKWGIDVANLSLGAEGCSDGSDPASAAMSDLVAAGIAPLVAVGNSGPESCTVGAPGASPSAITIGWAADPGAGGIFLSPSSSRGPTADGRKKPDLVAPGERITAAAAGTRSSYGTGSGSSFATAFAAGAAALVLDADPGASVKTLRGWLQGSAQDRGPAGDDNEYGFGMLRTYEVVRTASGGAHGGPVWPASQHLSGTVSTLESREFPFRVGELDFPLAITLVVPSWDGVSPDVELRVYGPDGSELVDTGGDVGGTRSQVVTGELSKTGVYSVEVYSELGSGEFFLDLSWSGGDTGLFAEGATHSGFETHLGFVNPSLQSPSSANVELLTSDRGRLSPASLQGIRMRPGGARSVKLNDFVPSDDLGIGLVSGYRGLVQERVVKRVGGLSYTDAAAVPRASPSWFVAEGATHSGFNAFLLVANPGESAVTVSVSYLTGKSGRVEPSSLQDFTLGPGKRRTISTNVHVSDDDVSAEVTASAPILVEHSMLRNVPNGDLGMLGSFGASEPDTSWFLADGTTRGGFKTFLLLANPNPDPATAEITFLTGSSGPVTPPKLEAFEIPAGSRRTVSVNLFVPSDDVAIEVSSDIPIVAERSMHKRTTDGHLMYDSIGVTGSAERWVTAIPGGIGANVAFVLIAVPRGASEAAEVRVTYLTPNGPKEGPTLTVEPGSRETTAITSGLSTATGALVESVNGVPIVTEMSVHRNTTSSGKIAAGGAVSTPIGEPPTSPAAP